MSVAGSILVVIGVLGAGAIIYFTIANRRFDRSR
jgi:hypothetical protein